MVLTLSTFSGMESNCFLSTDTSLSDFILLGSGFSATDFTSSSAVIADSTNMHSSSVSNQRGGSTEELASQVDSSSVLPSPSPSSLDPHAHPLIMLDSPSHSTPTHQEHGNLVQGTESSSYAHFTHFPDQHGALESESPAVSFAASVTSRTRQAYLNVKLNYQTILPRPDFSSGPTLNADVVLSDGTCSSPSASAAQAKGISPPSLKNPGHLRGANEDIRNSFPLPLELYRHVVCFMDDTSCTTWSVGLHALTYISRAWRSEAERYLYTHIDVPPGNILLLCRTLLARPDLAHRVRKLRFFANLLRPLCEGDLDMLSRTLWSVPNLRDLQMYGLDDDKYGTFSILHDESIFSMLRESRFKLYRFSADLDWCPAMVNFLESQPELRWLDLRGPRSFYHYPGCALPKTALPKCKCMTVEPLILNSFERPPPITHLTLNLCLIPARLEAEAAEQIGMLGDTLRVVTVNRINTLRSEPCLAPARLLARFAERTPHLSFLGIWDLHLDFSPRDNRDILNVVSKNFPELRVFVWAPPQNLDELKDHFNPSDYDSGWSTDPDDVEGTPEKLQRYASAMFSSHPTLQWFVAGGMRENWVFERPPLGAIGNLPRPYGPLPNPTRAFDFAGSFIDPEKPMDYIARYTRPVNTGRFWDSGCAPSELDYHGFLGENDTAMLMPDERDGDWSWWELEVASMDQQVIRSKPAPESIFDQYKNPEAFQEQSRAPRSYAI
ncbi:hypothetical protein K488DRAFT_88122 [Vararia minispora EC-137]|uniref:Uncharacterized protein n=1 Tax=Vararia minispora EC-137 TaxID=1314806 RepID=A0ACB8QEH1_9AGAM|nr:hypothetical protein K488DRAFT_88122 [Vararia minispora EC-137]